MPIKGNQVLAHACTYTCVHIYIHTGICHITCTRIQIHVTWHARTSVYSLLWHVVLGEMYVNVFLCVPSSNLHATQPSSLIHINKHLSFTRPSVNFPHRGFINNFQISKLTYVFIRTAIFNRRMSDANKNIAPSCFLRMDKGNMLIRLNPRVHDSLSTTTLTQPRSHAINQHTHTVVLLRINQVQLCCYRSIKSSYVVTDQ